MICTFTKVVKEIIVLGMIATLDTIQFLLVLSLNVI